MCLLGAPAITQFLPFIFLQDYTGTWGIWYQPRWMCVCYSLSCVRPFVTPTDCSLPGASIQGILQARTLEWVAILFWGSSQPRDQT